jgi:nucleotide-binding universal stress UspA family protein
MFRSIVVPLDGSRMSQAALEKALALAKEQGASVHLLSVYEPGVHSTAEARIDITDALRREAEGIVQDAARIAAGKGVEATRAVVAAGTRRIATAIAEEAQARGADLLVIGTHGRRGFERLVLGSVAEGVIRQSTVPVLLLPPAPA